MKLTKFFLRLKHLGSAHNQKAHGRGGLANLSYDERLAELYTFPGLYGEELLSGTRTGDKEQAENWLEGSKITQTLYHGSQRPESVLDEGFEAGVDEVIDTPGISLAFDPNYSKEYTGDKGKVFTVKVFAQNPVDQWSPKVKGFDPNDPADFDKKAKEQGFDATIGPGEVRVFSPEQIFIIGKNYKTSEGYKRFSPKYAD